VPRELLDEFMVALEYKGSFDYASSFELASLRMTMYEDNV
jgi:hypothetical protein